MVIKSTTAHIFHVGDARIYRVARQRARATDRRSSRRRLVGAELPRPRLGVNPQIEIDYRAAAAREGRRLPAGDRRRLRARRRRFVADTIDAQRERSRRGRAKRSSTRPTATAAPTTSPCRSSGSTSCPTATAARSSGRRRELPLPAAARSADDVRRLPNRPGDPRQQPQPHLSRRRQRRRRAGRHQDAVDRSARRPGLPAAIHDGGMDRAAHQQRPRAQAAPAVAEAQLPLCRHRIHRRPDPDAMDDRQSEAGPGNGARHRRADRQGPAGLPPAGNAAPGPAAGQHHDRQDRHGEDHRFRLDQSCRHHRDRHRPAARHSRARRNTRRRNISSAKAARRARTCFRSA